ncbi:MAG TPA: hypothetical protein VLG12_07575 [Candidatus Saccharimonadales bacterium]|nr:hypothetical protein [Candidatus Saccharimonadales bacterium]
MPEAGTTINQTESHNSLPEAEDTKPRTRSSIKKPILKRYPHPASEFNKRAHETTILSRWRLRSIAKNALKSTTGPLVEVGGPSKDGFMAIDNTSLPNGLIISNVEPGEVVGVQADVRGLPFADKSLGGILMKGLTRKPEDIAQAPHEFPDLPAAFQPSTNKADSHLFRLLACEKENDYSAWNDPEIMNFSLRLAMLKEARRTLEPGGVLIANTLSGGEIRLAESLGFDIIGTTVDEINRKWIDYNMGEFVFKLSNLKTPAGLFIESIPQTPVTT